MAIILNGLVCTLEMNRIGFGYHKFRRFYDSIKLTFYIVCRHGRIGIELGKWRKKKNIETGIL